MIQWFSGSALLFLMPSSVSSFFCSHFSSVCCLIVVHYCALSIMLFICQWFRQLLKREVYKDNLYWCRQSSNLRGRKFQHVRIFVGKIFIHACMYLLACCSLKLSVCMINCINNTERLIIWQPFVSQDSHICFFFFLWSLWWLKKKKEEGTKHIAGNSFMKEQKEEEKNKKKERGQFGNKQWRMKRRKEDNFGVDNVLFIKNEIEETQQSPACYWSSLINAAVIHWRILSMFLCNGEKEEKISLLTFQKWQKKKITMFIFVVVVSQTDTSKGNKNILSHGMLGISFFPVFFFCFFLLFIRKLSSGI